ncbi:DUF6281 family protein [Streptomyces sp. NPDC017943]|uniref:DUF6281 family protein n=1 Tax=Streptomyces sp. NPDC017943 TaxID=3365019 RepID=UPI0037B36852
MKTPLLSWALAAVAALSAACAPSPESGAQAEASCAYVVDYDGRRYVDRVATDVPVGQRLGTATRPVCDDTPGDGDDGEGPAPVTAFAVRGVDPAVAVAVAEEPGAYRLVVADSGEQLPPRLSRLLERP